MVEIVDTYCIHTETPYSLFRLNSILDLLLQLFTRVCNLSFEKCECKIVAFRVVYTY